MHAQRHQPYPIECVRAACRIFSAEVERLGIDGAKWYVPRAIESCIEGPCCAWGGEVSDARKYVASGGIHGVSSSAWFPIRKHPVGRRTCGGTKFGSLVLEVLLASSSSLLPVSEDWGLAIRR